MLIFLCYKYVIMHVHIVQSEFLVRGDTFRRGSQPAHCPSPSRGAPLRLLGRLQEHGLLEGNPSNLKVEVLKQATRALKHKLPVLEDILRLGGNKEQLVTQLEQWFE